MSLHDEVRYQFQVVLHPSSILESEMSSGIQVIRPYQPPLGINQNPNIVVHTPLNHIFGNVVG